MTEALPFSPGVIAEWLPFWKVAGCFLATFVLEDAAAIGAGLLLAAGEISWPAAFTACFLGIWLGDAGLYALARFAGRNWFERSRLNKFSTQVNRSQQWFTHHGTLALIFSRIIPGARLPTYLAAGFLRMPAPRFLLVTGVAAFIWTASILFLVQAFGAQITGWVSSYKSGSLLLLGAGILLLVALQLLRRACGNFDPRQFAARLGRWQRWEFWPMWLFYPPVVLNYFWLALKYRGLALPTAANPGIFSGGMVGESKMATLADLMVGSPAFTAEAERLNGSTPEARFACLLEICARRQIVFPFILKPDVGQRGAGVKLIRNELQARDYLRQTAAPLIVQRYAAGPGEAGIFYYRFPGEPHGQIFSITEKVFPVITGDGRTTITDLIWNDSRARFMAETYLQRLAGRENEVLPVGESLRLVEAGNHAQGCIFRDGIHLSTPALVESIDAISQKLNGFYVGRYDIRFMNETDLRAGKNFTIIELNGAAAEAGSIYDARNSLRAAYRGLFQQWELIFAIGAANRRNGCATTGLAEFWKSWRAYQAQSATYPAAD